MSALHILLRAGASNHFQLHDWVAPTISPPLSLVLISGWPAHRKDERRMFMPWQGFCKQAACCCPLVAILTWLAVLHGMLTERALHAQHVIR
jgi:hypothetical protein